MKKIIIALILLLSIGLVTSVDIIGCTSDTVDFRCDSNELCVCSVSGSCTDGNLMVYKDITNPLCLPPISDSKARIDWDDCDNPTDAVKVRAFCNEGSSSEKIISIVLIGTTTTTTKTTTTRTETTNRITTTTEEEKEECPYECCINEDDYEDLECDGDLTCCDHVCKESCEPAGGGKKVVLFIVGFLIIILIAAIVYLMKFKGGERPKIKWTIK